MTKPRRERKQAKCFCKVCEYSDEIRGLIKRQTKRSDKRLVEDLYERLLNAEEDAAYWRIRRHGGFEGLTDSSREKIETFYNRRPQ